MRCAHTLFAIGLLTAAAAVQGAALDGAGADDGGHERIEWDLVSDLASSEIDADIDGILLEQRFELAVSAYAGHIASVAGSFSRSARLSHDMPDGARLPPAPGRFMSAVPQGLPPPPTTALAVLALVHVSGAWRRLHGAARRRTAFAGPASPLFFTPCNRRRGAAGCSPAHRAEDMTP